MNSGKIKYSITGLILTIFTISPLMAQSNDGALNRFSIAIPIVLVIGFIFLVSVLFIQRYRRCPSDKILVVYGKTGSGSAKCYAGGAAFVWPVIQAYEYLDLTPLSIDVDLRGALSKQNIRVNVPSRFTVAISNEPDTMINAAERLLGKSSEEIKELAKDIIFGQLRLVVATMDIEEINSDRDKFLSNVASNVGSELKKIGLQLINVNVTDIQDESGYIEALGKQAASEAINQAKILVAVETQKGDSGEATADMQRRTQVAAANSDAEIGEKNAAAEAVKGKNLADIEIAESNSDKRRKVAEAHKLAEITEATTKAEAETKAYEAQTTAEQARKTREMAALRANEVVQEEIDREKTVIAADAEAEKKRKIAQGEADAVLANYIAEAQGIEKVLDAQAGGFSKMVEASGGNAQAAIGLLLIDKLPELAKIQTDAIKNLKFDKITVFDGGNGESTSGFVNNLFKSVPALSDFLNQSGLNLPEFLAKNQDESNGSHVGTGVSSDTNDDD